MVKEVPSGSMHLVEIDPPYAIDLHEAKKKEGKSIYTLEDYNEVPVTNYMDGGKDEKWLGMNTVFKECYRIMADHSWLLCWFATEPWFADIYNAILSAGFETTRMCPVWIKPSGQTKRPEMHLPNSYEMFFYAWKGRPAIAQPRGSNVFNYPPIPPQQKTHPTERPIELTRDMYRTFAFPGSRVFIPFLGSGNGLIAAHLEGMSGVGSEIGKGYKDSFLVKVNGMK
jgi:site-specific DNA-methyltransferase (adenine-specific)